MNTRVTETIFSGADMIIPMSSVQHIEKHTKGGVLTGITIITDKTKWNFQYDTWEKLSDRLSACCYEAKKCSRDEES